MIRKFFLVLFVFFCVTAFVMSDGTMTTLVMACGPGGGHGGGGGGGSGGGGSGGGSSGGGSPAPAAGPAGVGNSGGVGNYISPPVWNPCSPIEWILEGGRCRIGVAQ